MMPPVPVPDPENKLVFVVVVVEEPEWAMCWFRRYSEDIQ
jgi:hypothetical protein